LNRKRKERSEKVVFGHPELDSGSLHNKLQEEMLK